MVEEYFDKILPPSGKGRPRIILNEKGKQFIVMLAKYMVTEEEIAAEMDVTVETLHSRWNNDTFLECIKKGQQRGKVSLRRYQFKLAEKSATMAIYLGKVYLGQREDYEPPPAESEKGLTIVYDYGDEGGTVT